MNKICLSFLKLKSEVSAFRTTSASNTGCSIGVSLPGPMCVRASHLHQLCSVLLKFGSSFLITLSVTPWRAIIDREGDSFCLQFLYILTIIPLPQAAVGTLQNAPQGWNSAAQTAVSIAPMRSNHVCRQIAGSPDSWLGLVGLAGICSTHRGHC